MGERVCAVHHSSTMPRIARGWVEELHPAYFAMVMATGIIAIACQLLGFVGVASVFSWINVPAFCLLVLLTLVRAVLYPARIWADLVDHTRGIGFFTTVAATCVLGSQLIMIHGQYAAALVLWIVGIILWFFLTYTVFTAFVVKDTKPSLEQGINGGWLVSVVATQSVANLGVLLLPIFPGREDVVLFWALSLWLFGGMLYIWLIVLIFYRYAFFRFSPSDLMPPYWINMGAMAITTLVGCTLVANAEKSVLLGELLPFLKGVTVLSWATATWWIPMLVILGFWRHVFKRFKLAYDPLYWGAVFPLGMYTACTFRLADVIGQSSLKKIAPYFLCTAITAWLVVFCGLLHRLTGGAAGALGKWRQGRIARRNMTP